VRQQRTRKKEWAASSIGTKRKRRFVPVFLFVLVLIGTCAFLYPFAAPHKTDAGPLDGQKADVTYVRDDLDLGARTRNFARVYAAENRAVASGVGRIPENTAQGKLMGRRAALTDARRNLLVLRQKLLGDSVFNAKSRGVSGRVVVSKIHSERIEGNLYFLEVDAQLDELLDRGFDEKIMESE
jgi:hypothetical protein